MEQRLSGEGRDKSQFHMELENISEARKNIKIEQRKRVVKYF